MKKVPYYLKNKLGVIAVYEITYDPDTNEYQDLDLYELLSFNECVQTYLTNAAQDDLAFIRKTPKDDLNTLHMTLGMLIRNLFGLWIPNNPHVGKKHPDDYSFEIIEKIWEELQKVPSGSQPLF